MRFAFFGDVVGRSGRDGLADYLPDLRRRLGLQFVVVNAENAAEYAHQPEKIASRAYANRMANGDEESGDGWTYRGRGWLQTTGKSGYTQLSDATQIDFVSNPDAVATPEGAAISAAVFWEKHNLNYHVDNNDFVGLTKAINGGTIGLEDRMARFEHAMQILGG